jgi:hypothetical protein
MIPFSTCFIHKCIYCLTGRIPVAAILCIVLFFTTGDAKATGKDSLIVKKPVIITSLERCSIPGSMIMRIKHLSPLEMEGLNEEYQHTDLTEDGREIVTIVRMRFADNHITGYIKETLLNNSDKFQSINYIDIPVEWMCIPPKQDHPFHFATSVSELDSIKSENGCLDWVQRDNEVIIKFAQENVKPKKKSKSARSNSKTK